MAQTVSNGRGSALCLEKSEKLVQPLEDVSELQHDHSGSFGSSADVTELPDDQSLDAVCETSLIELHVSTIHVKYKNTNSFTCI